MSYLSKKPKAKEPLKLSNQKTKPLGCLDQTTNQRLNAMYQKFISKNRQSGPILKAKASQQSSNLNIRSQYSPQDEDPFFNKCQISIDKDISIEGIKMRFEDIIQAALQNYQAATQQYLNFIYQKFSKQVSRLRQVQDIVSRLQGKLTVQNLKNQQNNILVELNRQLQSKILSLQSQISTLKSNKQLSGLRSTLQRARQNNSMRQRNPTPGKDSRFDIQKKLLIKQNLQLKKQLQNTKKQYQLRLDQISSLKITQQKQDIRNIGYQQILIHAEQLQNKLQAVEFQVQRKTKLIYQLQQQLKQLQSKPIEQSQSYKLKYQILKNNLQSNTNVWNKRIQSKDSQLVQVKNKLMLSQQQSLQIKKQNIKRQARQSNNIKQIESLKMELAALKQQEQTSKPKRTDKQMKRQYKQKQKQNNDVQYDELKIQNDKLKTQNNKLVHTINALNSKPSEADGLRTQNNLLKQVMKSQKDKSIPKSSIIQAVKKIINIQPPKLKQSAELNSLLTDLYEELERTREEMLDHQLELKELRLHKNKIDHILHEQDQVNDFQTTQIDAHFYRSKAPTDAKMKQEIKKLAHKLDHQLTANVQANKLIKSNQIKIKMLEDNERKITYHLREIVNEQLQLNQREGHLAGLLQWSGLEDLTSLYHEKLFCSVRYLI